MTYPRKAEDGRTLIWACCESSIGPPCQHVSAYPLSESRIEGALLHLAHFKDGYPLCWPMDREGAHLSTTDASSVTCPDCKRHMKGRIETEIDVSSPETTGTPVKFNNRLEIID